MLIHRRMDRKAAQTVHIAVLTPKHTAHVADTNTGVKVLALNWSYDMSLPLYCMKLDGQQVQQESLAFNP